MIPWRSQRITVLYRVRNISEIDCFLDAFVYLSQNLPLDDFVLPLKSDLQRTSYKLANSKLDAHKRQLGDEHFEHSNALGTAGEDSLDRLPRPLGEKIEFPAILVMCGSAFVAMKVRIS